MTLDQWKNIIKVAASADWPRGRTIVVRGRIREADTGSPIIPMLDDANWADRWHIMPQACERLYCGRRFKLASSESWYEKCLARTRQHFLLEMAVIYEVALAHLAVEFDEESEIYFMDKSSFLNILKSAIQHVNFDENWYISEYDDVQTAITKGIYATPLQHYIEHGFVECRLPHKIEVDEEFYLNEYDDVRHSLAEKKIESAQWHFEKHGRAEGRLPYRGFSLLR